MIAIWRCALSLLMPSQRIIILVTCPHCFHFVDTQFDFFVQISTGKNRIFACSILLWIVQIKEPAVRNATSRYTAHWTWTLLCLLSISPSPRHVMFIDRVLIHPGWQLQFKVIDSVRSLRLFSSPVLVAARDLTCSVELSRRATRVSKHSRCSRLLR